MDCVGNVLLWKWEIIELGYTTPNAKLENDLHIVQRHMVKMHSIITKRNRRKNIPDSKRFVGLGDDYRVCND